MHVFHASSLDPDQTADQILFHSVWSGSTWFPKATFIRHQAVYGNML